MGRDAFFAHVRQAVRVGNRAGKGAGIPDRDGIGYQGGGADPVACFREEFTKAGGFFHLVLDPDSAARKVLEIVQQKSARRVLVGFCPLLDRLSLPSLLNEAAIEIISVDGSSRDQLFAADLGISGVDYLVAETGTVVMHSRTDQPRSLSLLPPVHIAVAEPAQIVPDLFDLFEPAPDGTPISLPSCISLITGPSKTGDIELRLVTGVHGPGEIHLILIAGSSDGLP
jgi:L-lactate dehydrogenase complex protein LldG